MASRLFLVTWLFAFVGFSFVAAVSCGLVADDSQQTRLS